VTSPVLPLIETVVFPSSLTPLAIGQKRSIELIDDAVAGDRRLALVTVKNRDAVDPGWDDLYRVGTAAIVRKMIPVPDGTRRVLVEGLKRVAVVRPTSDDPYLVAELTDLPDHVEKSEDLDALTRNVKTLFERVLELVPNLPDELQIAITDVDDPSALCSLVASTIRLTTDARQSLLELVDVGDRLREVSLILDRELATVEFGGTIEYRGMELTAE
jgi:ATP-dependent Lon protease